jgi:cysteine desulfurase family protein
MPRQGPDSPRRIYLDNAATSWPKPECVYAAADRYARECGAAAGRSAYRHAAEAERIVELARTRVARLMGAENPASVVFTQNGTDSLNMAIHGVLRPGDHVVTSEAEHNSVLRPLAELRERMGIEVSYVAVGDEGFFRPDDVLAEVRPNTRLVALIHASNVTGAVQPLEEIGRRLAALPEPRPLFLVDAAQSLGHWPLSVDALHADLLAAPGHKGLLGPLGTGILYVRPEIADQVVSLRQGGTGTMSEQDRQPHQMPHKFEAGNVNVVGLAGLGAAAEFLLSDQSVGRIRANEEQLTRALLVGLGEIHGVAVYGPPADAPRVGVVSMTPAGYDPQDFAAMLDAEAGIQTRSGLHCAPGMHRSLGTIDRGGTVRFSVGHANSIEEVETTLQVVRQLMAAAPDTH